MFPLRAQVAFKKLLVLLICISLL